MSGTSASRTGRVRVLIVDDEPALTEVLSVAVTEAGRRLHPAADGHRALRIARGRVPHAVVLDGMLPDLDGIQVLRRLRYENPKLQRLMFAARDALEPGIDGFPRDDWQPTVRELMRKARLVVLALGPGEGTMWELCEAMRSLLAQRLVLLVPMTRAAYDEFRRDAEKEFSARGIQVTPDRGTARTPRLPSRVVRGVEDNLAVGIREQSTPTATKGAVYFTRDWEPVHVSLAGGPMVSSLGFYDHLPRELGKGLIPAFLQLVAHEGRLAVAAPSAGSEAEECVEVDLDGERQLGDQLVVVHRM